MTQRRAGRHTVDSATGATCDPEDVTVRAPLSLLFGREAADGDVDVRGGEQMTVHPRGITRLSVEGVAYQQGLRSIYANERDTTYPQAGG